MRDASLDEFLATDGADEGTDGEAEPPETDAEGAGGDGSEAETETEASAEPPSGSEGRTGGEAPEAEPEGPPSVADVEPARSTFAWSADGAACAACGERVAERWESETGLVCTECKAW